MIQVFSRLDLTLSFLLPWLLLWPDLPSWVVVTSALIFAVRLAIEKARFALPSRWTLNALALGSAVLIKLSFGVFFGREASSSLIVLLTAFKVWEVRTDRDIRFLQVLVLGLIAVKFLFSFDLWIMLPSFLALFLLLSSMAKVSHRFLGRAKLVSRLLIATLPVAIFLFLIFPRYKSPQIWSSGKIEADSGFSNTLNPGSVASLAMDKTLAFRVEGLSANLSQEDLYFKGGVLNRSEGLSWSSVGTPQMRDPSQLKLTKDSIPKTYKIVLEPQRDKWLFVLAGTYRVDAEVPTKGFAGGNFELATAVGQRTAYEAWRTDLRSLAPEPSDLQIRDQDRDLLKDLDITTEGQKPKEVVANILKYFLDRGYIYSNEVSLDGDLRSFLKSQKRGYCEHFAGAVGTLLRAAGIPARVIIGYAGGEWNPRGNFWSITQDRAHAWIEYFDGQNWILLDPTLIISPSRFQAAQADSFLDEMKFLYESLNHSWNTFLIDFDRAEQIRFLQNNLKQIIAASLAIMGLIVVFSVFLGRRSGIQFLSQKIVKKIQKNLPPSMQSISVTPKAVLDYVGAAKTVYIWQLYYTEVYLQENADAKLKHQARQELSKILS